MTAAEQLMRVNEAIAELKAQREARVARKWTEAQLEARAVARDCMLDGRHEEAAAVLREHQMSPVDMIERLFTRWTDE